MNEKIQEAQRYLQEMKADGWLLYDFNESNELTRFFLEIPKTKKVTRRFFYWIPSHGDPVKIVHAIEEHVLDDWPGEKRIYLSWESLIEQLAAALKGAKQVAMEYSPRAAVPYVSKVDGGTVDLVRSFGIEVVSSGSFLPCFTAVITEAQGQSHVRAGAALDRIIHQTWDWIAQHLKKGQPLSDYDVQQQLLRDFQKEHLVTDGAPIVSLNARSADPHYGPTPDHPISIQKGDWVLIDFWAKEDQPKAIYADVTRVAVADVSPTQKQKEIFSIVRRAQIAATQLVKDRLDHQKIVYGWEVDDCARKVISDAGYGKFFIHRTGHNIEMNLHGSGANMDNLEMHDTRPILPSTCFSIEPGIYLPGEFGVRLEYDLYVHRDHQVEIVGGQQDEIVSLFIPKHQK